MNTMKALKINNTSHSKRFALILSVVFVILFASIAISAVDLMVFKEAENEAHAGTWNYTINSTSANSFLNSSGASSGYTNYTGTNSAFATTSIGGTTVFTRYYYKSFFSGNNFYHGSNRVNKTVDLTMNGIYGLLGRNGAIRFVLKCSGSSPTHKDNDWFLGFQRAGTVQNFASESETRFGGPGNHQVIVNSRFVGGNGGPATNSKIYRFLYGADDGTYWAPFKNYNYNTDSNITGWMDMYVLSDSAAPTIEVNRVETVNGTKEYTAKRNTVQAGSTTYSGYAQQKILYIGAYDNLSGVNPYSVSISAASSSDTGKFSPMVTAGSTLINHLVGRNLDASVSGNGIKVKFTGNASIIVRVKDCAGREASRTITVSGIDTAGPSLSTTYYTYDSRGNTSTTNNSLSNWTNDRVGVRVVASDSAGVITGTYKVGATGYTTYSGDSNTKRTIEHSVTANTSSIAISAYDMCSNRSTATAAVNNIDKAAPTLNSNTLSLTSGWTNGNVTLTSRFTDTASKIWRIRVWDNMGYDQSSYLGSTAAQKSVSATSSLGTSHTAQFTLTNYRTYYIQATDHAGNNSTTYNLRPNIDKAAPTVGNVSLTGKKWEAVGDESSWTGADIDARNDYVFSSVTVKLGNPGDAGVANASGVSGLLKAELHYANSSGGLNGLIATVTPSSSTFTFTRQITYNSVERPYGYRVRIYDTAGNSALSDVLYPKKDDTTPDFVALSGNMGAWTNAANREISVQARHGQSGISLYKSRSTISTTGTVSHTADSSYFKYVGKDSVSVTPQSGTVKTKRGTTNYYANLTEKVNVSTQGIEYYYFRLETGAGYKSSWYGNNVATALAAYSVSRPTEASFNGQDFTGQGVRTMLDRTAPKITLVGYSYGSSAVPTNLVETNGNSYYQNPVTSVWEINDGVGHNANGINGSGGILNGGYTVTYSVYYLDSSGNRHYTYINGSGGTSTYPSYPSGGGATPGVVSSYSVTNLNWNKAKSYGNGAGVNGVNQFTVAALTISQMYNFIIKYTGETIVPQYEITVTDSAGNTSTATKKLYIDTITPTIGTPEPSPYVWGQWTNQSINVRIGKTFGQSGTKLYYYFDPIKTDGTYAVGGLGQVPSWGELSSTADGNGISGTNQSHSTEAIMNIDAKSRVGKLWFRLVSGANKVSVYTSSYEIKIDNTAPESLGYEFRDAKEGKIIPDGTWSSTLVSLRVFTSDGNGSGVRAVTATAGGVAYELSEVSENIWATPANLNSAVYIIKIFDKVPVGGGNVSTYDRTNPQQKSLYETHSPLIDTETPTLIVNANSGYDTKKGIVVPQAGKNVYQSAIPERVQITLGITTSTIKSGAKLYILDRDLSTGEGVADYIYNRYSLDNINLEALEAQGWVEYHSIQATTPASTASTSKTVGLQNSTVHRGYDFLLVSGSGLMAYVDYGAVFIDMQTPQFDAGKSLYTLDSGATATGVLPDESGNGLWTNSKVSAKLYIGDASGSGIKSVTVTKGSGSPMDITATFVPESVYGIPLNYFARSISSVKISRLVGGSRVDIIINSSSYSLHDLATGSQIRLSSALDVRGDDFLVVSYVDTSGITRGGEGTVALVPDTNDFGNGFYLFDFDDASTYLITYTDNAGNSGHISRSPMIDRDAPSITVNATAGGTSYNLNPASSVFTTNSVVMNVNLGYGDSAFPYRESEKGAIAYQKGRELYVLEVSMDGVNFMQVLAGTATVDETLIPGVTFKFVSQTKGQAQYTVTFSSDMKQQFSFRLRNGVTSISTAPTSPKTTATPMSGGQEMKPYVKIDKTAPVIANINFNVAQNRWTGANWYYANVVATLLLAGNDIGDIDNIIGSGLSKVVMNKYKANDTSTLISSVTISGASLNTDLARQGRFDFTFDGYYSYRFVAEDNMGNSVQSQLFTVNIDKEEAALSGITARLTNNDVYVPGVWTYLGMTFSAIGNANLSGFRIQYSTSSDSLNYTAWTNLTNGVVNAHTYNLPATHTATLTIPPSANQNNIYRFRIITKAGLDALNAGTTENNLPAHTYKVESFGRVQIDSVVPTFTQVVARDSSSRQYVQDTWTASDLQFSINVTRGASGSFVAVSINGTDYYTGNETIGSITNNTSTSPSMTLNKDIDAQIYYFRVTSNAGLSSVYSRTVGGVSVANWGIVKIDKRTPNIQAVEYKAIKPEDVVYNGGIIDYAASWDRGTTYTPGNWSAYFLLARVQVLGVGKSQGYLKYSDEIGAEGRVYKDKPLTQNELLAKGWLHNGVNLEGKDLSDGSNVAYMILQENQNRQYSFMATSYAGLSRELVVSTGNIRMDMDKPFMTVQVDTAQKSKKWTSDAVNDLHKWYVSNAALKFTQARYSGSQIVHSVNLSGSKLYYTAYYLDAGGSKVTVSDWTEIAQQAGLFRLNLSHNALRPLTYEFKIVSGAGLECYLTEDYASVSAPSADYPWLKNLSGDSKGSYTMKIDTQDYSINVQQWLKEYRDANNNLILSGVNINEMAQMTVYVNGGAVGNPQGYQSQTNTVYTAKRGDAVQVVFNANAYDALNGYGYIYKRAEYSGTILSGDSYQVVPANSPIKVLGDNENTGSVSFDICDANYMVKTYFTKEISLAYQGLEHTLQYNAADDPNRKSTVSSAHAVSQLGFIIYYNGIGYVPYGTPESYVNTTTAPKKVGSYALTVAMANDNAADPNYRLHNPTGNHFVIRYFVNVSETNVPRYNINNAGDLSYIDIYNNSSSSYNFLEANHSIASYAQMQNFTIDAAYRPISGVFTGTYNGGHYDISASSMAVSNNFGIFNAVSGTVESLGVRIGRLTITSGENVGFVTGKLIEGGTLNGCYAIGEIEASGTNANIGGLVGYIDEGFVLTSYSNVNFTNKGNMLSGNIGGLAGMVTGSTTRLFRNFVLGPMEIYNVPTENLMAGTFAGQIASIDTGEFFQGNKFLLNNLFINEEILSYTYGVAKLGAGIIPAMSPSRVEGLGFTRFVQSTTQYDDNIALVVISTNPTSGPSTRSVQELTENRIREQGMMHGLGTAGNPFIVTSLAGLEFIDKYPWAHYRQDADIAADTGFNTIAAHKVFTGSYDGMSTPAEGSDPVQYKISNITINSSDNVIGIFGKVAGAIKNLYINNLDINVNYAGTLDVMVGGVTANIIAGASLEAVYVLGNIYISAPNATVYVGGIAGRVNGANIKDILSIANVKVENTLSAHTGGTVGHIRDSVFNKIFSLARVEASYRSTGSVGAIAGSIYGTTTANMQEFYAIKGNTYKNGNDVDEIVGYAPGSVIVDINQYIKDFDSFRGQGQEYILSNGTNLESILITLYPFAKGKGTLQTPFEIHTVEDFFYINDFLYAHYKIKADLDFTGITFKTIGVGAKFTGSIDGGLSIEEQTQSGDGVRTRRLNNLNNAFVYFNAGTISNLRVHTVYSLITNTDVIFGSVAVYNSGTLQNLVVEGNINIMTLGSRTVVVGGMVGQSLGGAIIGDSTIVSSMTGTNITVSATQVSIGGVVGEIKANTTLNYLVSNGAISGYGLVVNAGTIAGAIYDGSTINENEIAASAVIYINGTDTYTLDEFDNKVYQQFGYYFE